MIPLLAIIIFMMNFFSSLQHSEGWGPIVIFSFFLICTSYVQCRILSFSTLSPLRMVPEGEHLLIDRVNCPEYLSAISLICALSGLTPYPAVPPTFPPRERW